MYFEKKIFEKKFFSLNYIFWKNIQFFLNLIVDPYFFNGVIEPIYKYDSNYDHLIDRFFTSISCNLFNIDSIVRFFLDHCVSPDEGDRNCTTPLYHAICLGSFHFVHLLVQTRKSIFHIERANRTQITFETKECK